MTRRQQGGRSEATTTRRPQWRPKLWNNPGPQFRPQFRPQTDPKSGPNSGPNSSPVRTCNGTC